MSIIGDPANLLTTLDPPAFLHQISALCAQTDPEVFFPERGGSPRAAKAICAACPARAACLDYALAHREPHGVWGGLSATQRQHRLTTTRSEDAAA